MPLRMRAARPRAQQGDGRHWYRLQNNVGTTTATLHIYDEIGYWGITASDLVAELSALDASELAVHINSPGGEIFDGIAIMNALRSHTATVTTYVDSLAASIASVIAMAGDRIVMAPHSQMMIHDGSGVCIGDVEDMRAMAELLDRQSDNIASIYASRAGGTAKQGRARMQAETWYTAAEAVEAGLADEVAKPEPRPGEEQVPENAWDLSIFNYAGRDKAPAPDAAPAVEPEPAAPEEPGFDPASFRDALDAAEEPEPVAFDPAHFRSLMAGLATNAPAPPDPASPAPAPTPAAEAASPDEQPGVGQVLSDYLRTIFADVANNAPAPPEPKQPAAAPAEDPVFTIDRYAFESSLREARL